MMFMVSARNRLLKIVVSNNKQIRCFVVVILLFTLCQNVGMQPKYCRICNIVTLLYLKSNVPKYDLYFYVFRHPTALFLVCPSAAFNRLFVRTDLVTTISRERLERSQWNLHGNSHKLLLMTWLDFGGQRSRPPHAVEMEKALRSTLGRQSLIIVLTFLSFWMYTIWSKHWTLYCSELFVAYLHLELVFMVDVVFTVCCVDSIIVEWLLIYNCLQLMYFVLFY